MSEPRLEKVTVNIGAGASGQPIENARTLLERLTGGKPVTTKARRRDPAFKLRKGDEIGAKVTLRGVSARTFLDKALETRDRELSARSFDNFGNLSFGVKEYIDFPGAKYDPKLGMIGFDVCVSLRKPGSNIAKRRIAPRRLPRKQRVSAPEARAFMEREFKVKVGE
ncbi:MAG: 50S ribosomal protein L5 [Candidatus Micrarchaeia archaeon]